MQLNETKNILGLLQHGAVLDVGSGSISWKQKNIVTLDKENPAAHILIDFMDYEFIDQFDTLLFTHSLRYFKSFAHAIKKTREGLKPGGYLILIEKHNPQKDCKIHWGMSELMGYMYMFEKDYKLEHRLHNGESYTLVYRRRADVN